MSLLSGGVTVYRRVPFVFGTPLGRRLKSFSSERRVCIFERRMDAYASPSGSMVATVTMSTSPWTGTSVSRMQTVLTRASLMVVVHWEGTNQDARYPGKRLAKGNRVDAL